MVAVSQAPSPESNPNPPLPVRGKVVHYTTFYLIGGVFVQRRTGNRRFRYIGLRQQLQLPREGRWSLFRPRASSTPSDEFPRRMVGRLGICLPGISRPFGAGIPLVASDSVGEITNRLMSRTQSPRVNSGPLTFAWLSP